MFTNSSIKSTIAFNHPALDSKELEEQAQSLLAQMKDRRDTDAIEIVDRVLDPNSLAGKKAMGASLVVC